MEKLEYEPLFEALSTVLTKKQLSKMKKLAESYPNFFRGELIVDNTKNLSGVLETKTCNVVRDLELISKATERLKVKKVFVDKRTRLIKDKVLLDDPFGHEEQEAQRGGHGRSRYVQLKWKVYQNDSRQNN
jgi:hypothetical protein